MTFQELFERCRLHLGDVLEGDILLLFNRHALDFVMRTRYGITSVDQDDDITGYKVIKLNQVVITNDGEDYDAGILHKYEKTNLTGLYGMEENFFFVSVSNQTAYLWVSDSSAKLAEGTWSDYEYTAYGVFWKDIDISTGSLDIAIDDVIANAVLLKIYSEVLSRNPKMFPLAEKYDEKYRYEIMVTKQKYYSNATTARIN